MIDISQDQLQTIQAILKHYVPDYEVRAFGSRFTWTAKDYSDLDLAIVGPGKLPFKEISALKTAFEESDLTYRVDVLDWHALSPEFQRVIEQGYEVIQKTESGINSDGWNTWKIGDIGRIVTGKTPPTQNPNNFGSKYPFITPRDMLGQKRIKKTERYLSEEGKNTVKNCLLPAKSVCVSCIGSDMGKVVMTTRDSITNQQLNSVICKASFDPDFVYYALIHISDELRNAGHSSTAVPILNKTDFSNFEITAPDTVTQRRIAGILSALDDKIELNRQTNATLESIAQAIFKEWFVDFNFPGATGEMVESELGMIPQGWIVGKIRDFAKGIQYGLTQSASTMQIGPHFLRITDIQNGQISWANVPYCEVEEKDVKKYKIENYDIFIARTGASTGENVLAINPPNAAFASYLIRIQFTYPQLAVYVGKLLRTRQYFEFIDSIKSGSAQPNANAQELTGFDIVLPPLDVLDNYFRIVVELENIKAEYQAQFSTLAALRNELLPKLMSGEIEV